MTAASETYLPVHVHPTTDYTLEEPEVNMLTLSSAPTTDETFLVPLLIGDAGVAAPAVADSSQPEFDAVMVLETLVAFNRTEGTITVPLPWGAP